MDALTLARATAPDAEIAGLLQAHFDLMRASSPAESCHVMEPQSVFDEADVVFTAQRNGILLGIGALKRIDPTHGELKSMHTIAAARGQGVGAALLRALLDAARDLGLARVSLETGSAATFAPARALYRAQGFVECPPFGEYVLDPLSIYMSRSL